MFHCQDRKEDSVLLQPNIYRSLLRQTHHFPRLLKKPFRGVTNVSPDHGGMSAQHAAIIVTVVSSSSAASSGDSMACVIAQQRVHPVVVHGNPLTEHKQLFVRACGCVHQQVPSLTGWKWCPQPHRSKGGKHLALRSHHLRDALTCVACWRRSAITGKVQVLTWRPTVFFCHFLSVRWFETPRTVVVFRAPQIFDRHLTSFCASFLCVSEEGDGKKGRWEKGCFPCKLWGREKLYFTPKTSEIC